MRCPICHSTSSISYYKANMPQILSACPEQALKKVKILPFEARLCLDCSLGFNATPLDTRTLKSIYDDYLYISPRRGIGVSKFEGMLDTIKRNLWPTNAILDVGCSEGYLLEKLREDGYPRLTGIEPGPQAIEAQRIGLDVHCGYFHARSFPGKRFNGIILMHVFEHLPNPVAMLKALKGKLAPEGKLIIEVPDFTGYHHQHLFFYTLNSLRKLAEDAGLKTIDAFEDGNVVRLVMVSGHEDAMTQWGCELNRGKVNVRALSIVQEFRSTVQKLRTLCKTHKKIYWWGAGSSSVVWLNQINGSALVRTKLIVVDGDPEKWGRYIPGVNLIVNPYTILNGATVDLMVIASEFSKDIRATMATHGIHARRVEVVV